MTQLSVTASQVLSGLEAQGSSEASAVAECLRNIAHSGDEQATDAFLATCAQELAQHALAAALRLNPRADEPILRWSLGVADVQEYFQVANAEAAEFLRNHQYEILDRLDAKAQQLLRDYGEIDELPPVDNDQT